MNLLDHPGMADLPLREKRRLALQAGDRVRERGRGKTSLEEALVLALEKLLAERAERLARDDWHEGRE